MSHKKDGPILTVDALIEDDRGRILLIKRGVEPFKGEWCLPGGMVENGERVEAALEREMIEEIGVRIGIRELHGVYSDPDRDPRGHYVTVAFHATVVGGEPTVSKEAEDLFWISRNDENIPLGFDHGLILQDWWNRKSDGAVKPSQDTNEGKPKPRIYDHPVDPMVQQVKDGTFESGRVVEDEAARGKRVARPTENSGTNAVPMTGSGTKRTAQAGKTGKRTD